MYSAHICCVKEIYCSLRSSNLHIHFLPFHQENARDDIASLKKELAAIRQLHDAGFVDSALSLLRQHLALHREFLTRMQPSQPLSSW